MQANISNNVNCSTGTGAWTMSGSGNSVIRSITGGSTVLTNEAQHTIQGTGNLGSSNLGINNKGTIIANQATPLTVAPSTTAFMTNTGTLKATSGGTLSFSNNSFLTSTGGVVQADDLSTVNLPTGFIFNGTTLTTSGSASSTLRLAPRKRSKT